MSTLWQQARDLAAGFGPLEAVTTPLTEAAGLVLAADLVATTDLPPFTSSAMDGWAVCGPPPWTVVGEVLAGGAGAGFGGTLAPGRAVRIATGAALPAGAEAIVRSEHGTLGATGSEQLDLAAGIAPPVPGQDVRAAATECRAGDVVATAGQVVVPALLGLAAAAGLDTVPAVPRPVVDILVVGEELLSSGTPSGDRVRDALGPMLPPWLERLGAAPRAPVRVDDTLDELAGALARSAGDLVVTTGSTARGPRDHLHDVLDRAGAQLLADGVDVRPGHPMLLARLADGRPLVGLPGNPLAAVTGLVTLAAPVLRALRGLAPGPRRTVRLTADVAGHPTDVRLLPVRGGQPLRYVGPAMLRGLTSADGLAAIPPGGAAAGDEVEVLAVPD